jgi:hypothetical protein
MAFRNILSEAANDDARRNQFITEQNTQSSPVVLTGLNQDRGNFGTNDRASSTLGDPGEPAYPNEGFVRILQNASNSKPNGRLKNPLGFLASYTYQLSLYLISPSAYEAFVASGRRSINVFNSADAGDQTRGAYLIAQGGGMGEEKNRAPGFEFDYYIDGLTCKTYLPAKSLGANSVNIEYKFKITEPYGFSFVSNLAKAQQAMLSDPKNNFSAAERASLEQPQNTTRNFFILGVRFFGWDQEGNLVKGNEIMPDGKVLDPNASGTGALFESFTELVFTEFKFKVDGRSTVYQISGQPTAVSGAINVRNGMITENVSVTGTTVRDMLVGPKGLLTQLNSKQKTLKDTGSVDHPITYKIKWLGAEDIANASVITENIQSKSVQGNKDVENSSSSNDASATAAKPNKNVREMNFSKIPVVQCIEQVISTSRYILDSLSRNYTDDNQVDPKTGVPKSKEGGNKKLSWFNISPELTNIRWDTTRNDWVYDIVYVIQPYDIPNVPAPYVNSTSEYYGPHKRYDYWYTGKNTEIIGYEQTINNNYFLTTLSSDTNPNDPTFYDKRPGVSAVDAQPGGDNTTAQGTSSLSALNSFRTTLYDPGSFAKAKIQILGDPDYLMNSTSTIVSDNRFYDASDNRRINPSTNQVFMEIDFKEAVDYNVGSGTTNLVNNRGAGEKGQPGVMKLNDDIEFWRYSSTEASRKVDGISYQIITVVSNFNNGSFTQTIDAVINPLIAEGALTADAIASAREESSEEENNEADETGNN